MLHHAPQLTFVIGGICLPHGGEAEEGLVEVTAALGPAHYGGIPYPVNMVPVSQKMIQGGGVGERGELPGGGVQVLFFSVRAECRGVEGHQGRAAGLGPGHVFDGGVDALHQAKLSRDQADALWSIAGGVVVVLPRLPDGRIIVDETFRGTKDQVAAGENVVQVFRQGWVLPGGFRVPRAKELQHGLGGLGVYILQDLLVEGLASFKALPAPLGFAFIVNAQNVAGIVTEKVGGHAAGPLHRCRERENLRSRHSLFPPSLLCLDVDDLFQASIVPNTQGERHLDRAPPRGGDLRLTIQDLVVLGQRL